MKGWSFLLGALIVAAALGALYSQLRKSGAVSALEKFRERPSLVAVVIAELVLILGASYKNTTTTRWASVGWFLGGLAVALAMLQTVRQVLHASAPAAKSEKTAAEPALPDSPPPPIRRPYIWVLEERQIYNRMHAAPVTDRIADRHAFCGYEYGYARVQRTGSAVWAPDDFPSRMTCGTCRSAVASLKRTTHDH
jgi:hypothetical protein